MREEKRFTILGFKCSFQRFSWAFGLYKFDDEPRWVLHLFGLWVTLKAAQYPPKDEMLDKWAISIYWSECAIHLGWGHRYKILHFPWALESMSTDILHKSMKTWISKDWREHWWQPWLRRNPYKHNPDFGTYGVGDHPDAYRVTGMALRYVTRAGKVQDFLCDIREVRRYRYTWRMFALLRIPLCLKVRQSVSLSFSEEVGSERGTYKGGVVGTGGDMGRNEAPALAVLRLEKEWQKEYHFG